MRESVAQPSERPKNAEFHLVHAKGGGRKRKKILPRKLEVLSKGVYDEMYHNQIGQKVEIPK